MKDLIRRSLPTVVCSGQTVAADIESCRTADGYVKYVLKAASACHVGIDKKLLAEIIPLVNGSMPERSGIEYDESDGCVIYRYSFTVDESHLSDAALRANINFFYQVIGKIEENILTISQIMDKAA